MPITVKFTSNNGSEPSICLAVNMAPPATAIALELAVTDMAGKSMRTSPVTSLPSNTRLNSGIAGSVTSLSGFVTRANGFCA